MSKGYLDKQGLAQLWSKIKKYIADRDIKVATPVGGSITWYGPESTIPSDWMREDGRSLNKNEYPDLFAVIGYTYGGSGENFNLPNSKGRVVVHLDESDNDFKTLGSKYGWKNYTLTEDEMPSHSHNVEDGNYQGVIHEKRKVLVSDTNGDFSNKSGWVNGYPYIKFTGGSQAHPNTQLSIIAYKIIKVKEDAASKNVRLLDDALSNLQGLVDAQLPLLTELWTNRLTDNGICKLKPGADWNTCCENKTGFFMGANMTHAPLDSADWFYVINIVHNSLYHKQIAYHFFSNRTFQRFMNNGVWSGWVSNNPGNGNVMTATTLWENYNGADEAYTGRNLTEFKKVEVEVWVSHRYHTISFYPAAANYKEFEIVEWGSQMRYQVMVYVNVTGVYISSRKEKKQGEFGWDNTTGIGKICRIIGYTW